MSFSALPGDLLAISPKSNRFHAALARHNFEGIFDNPAERERLMSDMGSLNAGLLENHGYIACAPSVPACWSILYDLEQATKAHLAALSTGEKITPLAAEQASRDQASADQARLNAEDAAFLDARWAAQLRQLDRLDPSYKE